jgi:hypothetical protein
LSNKAISSSWIYSGLFRLKRYNRLYTVQRYIYISQGFLCSPKKFWGSILLLLCLFELISSTPLIRNWCCGKQVFLQTRACGQRSLKVILESSRSLRAYNTKCNHIPVKASETYTECYRQYMQYIDMAPGVTPPPP